ncbi:PIN domain-containing protein [Nostoc sp.]|uniref:PIN domain-containing protein n=1 Tax=Nostoc sp. TaxID=1180 RepID=UPI002FF7FEDD
MRKGSRHFQWLVYFRRVVLGSITILPFGVEEAELAAQIRSILKTAGTPIGSYDVLIAATAVIHNHN